MKKSKKIFPAPIKNKFFNIGSGILTAGIVLNSANIANAFTAYNFSLSNEDGPVSGIVEGAVFLPDGDGTFPASDVIITSAPVSLGYTTFPFNALTGNIFGNSFTVDDGVIDASKSFFESQFFNNALFGLNTPFSGGASYLTDINNPDFETINTGILDSDSSTLTYSQGSPPLTFNFSFSNNSGKVDGSVGGLIQLSDLSVIGLDIYTIGASSVVVTSAPQSLGYSLPLDVLTGNIFRNSFTVDGGVIDASNSFFESQFFNNALFGLNTPFSSGASYLTDINNPDVNTINTGILNSDSPTLTSFAVNTPEGTSIITLVGLGILGVSCKLKKKL